MITQVFNTNAAQYPDAVQLGESFQADVFFPKIRNLNRLPPEHRTLTFTRTEKFDGQNIGTQRKGDCLVFYSRNGLLDLKVLGKRLNQIWSSTDWDGVHAALQEGDTLYFEAVGNHRDFDYQADFPPDGQGLIAFALRKANGQMLDPSGLPTIPLQTVPVLETGPLPNLSTLRGLLDSGREGYVFTTVAESEDYIAYKAKRRELLEEATDDERESILASDDPPGVKIAKIVCTLAKVKHLLQKLQDGELSIKAKGIGSDGKWDGSNAIIPTLIKVVQNDCWDESGDMIRKLQNDLNVPGKQVNRALEDRVRSAFFELTLQESLIDQVN